VRRSVVSGHLQPAFSLIEVVLAIGIIAFAIVGIIGLMPVALKTSQVSQRETRATFIAQSIFNDLRAGAPTNCFIALGTNLAVATNRGTVSLTNNADYYANYSDMGTAAGTNTAANFSNPITTGAVFTAQLRIATNNQPAGISQVDVTVETPASAPSTNRSRYIFTTLMRQN